MRKKISLILLLILVILISAEGQKLQAEWEFPHDEIAVEFVNSSYKIASGKTSGFFKTGQKADLMLSGVGFNDAGGPLLFNHPGNIATDGRHLLLADRNNNRILIWNTLPQGNIPPDIVLGQKDFITNNPGDKLAELNWPVGVATDGKHIVVADTENDRILIWNGFPTENGKAADLVLGGDRRGPIDAPGQIRWPWAVWTDGKKLIVASTGASQVLIWKEFPSDNNQPPDVILQLKGKFGTPRSIGSDGRHLIIGDHNAFGRDAGNFFWKSFPVSNNQMYDFFIEGGPGSAAPPPHPGPSFQEPVARGEVFWSPLFSSDGKVLAFGNQIYIWDSFPQNEHDLPDLIVGITGPGGRGYFFNGGDGSCMALVNNRLYLSLSNGNKIVGFNSLPTQSDQLPDFAIGSPDIFTNTLETNFIISNPITATDGKSLFVSSDFDNKLYIWKSIPGESGAKPDIVYRNIGSPWDNEIFKNTLVLAGHQNVFIWKKLPLSGEKPDLTFKDFIGNVKLQDLKGVTLDDRYFYLADYMANKVYVWEGIPDQNSNPKFSLNVNQPWRLSSDGRYLIVVTIFNQSIKVYPVATLSSFTQPTNIGGPGRLNLPQSALVSHGHLFIADTCFNRVHVWKRIEDALQGKDADVILGTSGPSETKAEIGSSNLFSPAGLAFDGNYLWVGEFKFSERILRFSPQ